MMAPQPETAATQCTLLVQPSLSLSFPVTIFIWYLSITNCKSLFITIIFELWQINPTVYFFTALGQHLKEQLQLRFSYSQETRLFT